jgi:hypothetical protein
MSGKMLKILDRIPLFQLRRVRPAEPSADDVREVWRVTCAKYGTTVVDKRTAEDQKLIARILDAMGIVPDADFMTRFVTTLGNRIYVPFTPGTVTPIWSLRAQVEVLVHENEHRVQDLLAGPDPNLEYEFNYATNSTKRAYFEMVCYRAGIATRWRLWREEPDMNRIAQSMKESYACDDADVAMVLKMLKLSWISIRKGAMPSEVARFVCEWFEARWS